jgi:predicted 2-oxoglutarate/Fe(II)-dependent dioxygenase YbiX
MDAGAAGPADILTGDAHTDTTVRRALDITVDERILSRIEHALAEVRSDLARHFDVPLTDSVGVTFLRYLEGGRYRRHQDADPRPGSGTEDRRVSLIVWLTSGTSPNAPGDFTGGVLRLWRPGAAAPDDLVPEAGTLVAFPSVWPHEVLPVTGGVRDAVVDWLR